MKPLSKVISYIFHPVFLPTAVIVIIYMLNSYVSQTTPFAKKLFIATWIFINTAVLPISFTVFLRWRGIINSFQLEKREDRILPFTFSMFFYLTNYWLMKDVPVPQVFYSLFLGSSIAVAFSVLLTFITKISIHMVGMGGLTAAIFGMSQLYDLQLAYVLSAGILASGLVGSARYALKTHDLRQLYIGWFTGFMAVYFTVVNSWG